MQSEFVLVRRGPGFADLGFLRRFTGGDEPDVSLWQKICDISAPDLQIESRKFERADFTLFDSPPTTCSTCSSVEKQTKRAALARWEAQRKRNEQGAQRSAAMLQAKYGKPKVTVGTQTKLCWVNQIVEADQAGDLRSCLANVFLERVLDNATKKSPRYNDEFYELAALLYLTSRKAYRVLRQVLVLPAPSSLYNKYQSKFHETAARLLDLSQAYETLDKMRERIANMRAAGQQVNANFTLSIDAFCFRTFCGTVLGVPGSFTRDKDEGDETLTAKEGDMKFSHGFLFLLVPHDYRLPVTVLHLAASETGSYNAEIGSKAHELRLAAKRKGLHIWFKATDGDPGLSNEHTEFYVRNIAGKTSCFQSLTANLNTWICAEEDAWIPISDPLHVLKNLRAKLIKHPIVLFPSSPPTSFEQMRTILKLGAALDDFSQIGKMRDGYVLSLFTFDNVVKLLEAGQYVSGVFLFPFACWVAVIFSEKIDLGLRLFLVELAFQIVNCWFTELPRLNAEGIHCRGSKGSRVTFCDGQYTRRILNTLAAFGLALQFSSNNIRLDCLGTHLVENSIGIARATSSDPRYERIIQTYVHAEVRKEIAAKWGIVLYVQGRINDGGCKIDPDYERDDGVNVISKPKEWRVDVLLEFFRGICNTETAPALTTELGTFISELQSLVPALDTHEYNTNTAANSGIMARLISLPAETRV